VSSTARKLGAYVGGLAVAFGAAFAIGAAAGPISTPHQEVDVNGDATHSSSRGHGANGSAAGEAAAAGLAVTEAGYTLRAAATTVPAGADVPFRFTVIGPDGTPVTRYRETHEKELHLIVVRRDLAAFQHVHPTRGADGAWSVPLDLTAAGTYRIFADFAPAALDRTLTLGTDIFVAGEFRPVSLPVPATATTVDRYDITLDGAPVAGRESELTFTVAKDGAKVTDLQPYLGAFGHLVSLRAGDLAYLHTHPAEDASAGEQGGPQVRFATVFPTPGSYRLFLDFQHAGTVRTAAFTVTVAETTPAVAGSPADTASHDDGAHGH
jgi:hypothetical protein